MPTALSNFIVQATYLRGQETPVGFSLWEFHKQLLGAERRPSEGSIGGFSAFLSGDVCKVSYSVQKLLAVKVSSSCGGNTAVLSPGWSFNSCPAVQLIFLRAE